MANTELVISNRYASITFQPGNDAVSIIFQSTKATIKWLLGTNQQDATIASIETQLGKGQAIKLTRADDSIDYMILHDEIPFVCVRRDYSNPTNLPANIVDADVAKLHVEPSIPFAVIKSLGCDGLVQGMAVHTSYTFMTIVEPKTMVGIVAGWISQEICSGTVVYRDIQASSFELLGRCEFGSLRVDSGETRRGDLFGFGWFANCFDGLDAYASAITRYHDIKLQPIKGGYCTWYAGMHNGAADEASIAELAEFCSKELVKYGFEMIQIDDKWQAGPERKDGPRGDFTTHDSKGPYPSGMKYIAAKITTRDMKAGLWLMPFAWHPDIDAMKGHQDWYVRRKSDNSIYTVGWAGACLDMTHPAARAHVGATVKRITDDWGYRYLKMDAMWTGLAVKLVYSQDPVYTPDGFGDALFYDPHMTNTEAYRAGMHEIRKSVAPGTFLLGCTIAQNLRSLGAAMGLVDAMRIGRDIGPWWPFIIKDAEMGGRLYFLNGKVWWNDPDCLMLRKPLTLGMARAWGSWVAVSGQLNIVSEWLPAMDAERLDVVKRTFPMIGISGRPLDLFTQDPARIWHLADTRGKEHARRDVIAIFNWCKPLGEMITLDLLSLGIPAGVGASNDFVGFSFWDKKVLKISKQKLVIFVPFGSCKVISIRRCTDHPQVISTSRHVTQGILELTGEKWDGKALIGTSEIVGGDPYVLYINVPRGYSLVNVEGSSRSGKEAPKIKQLKGKDCVQVQFLSSMNCIIEWKMEFSRKP